MSTALEVVRPVAHVATQPQYETQRLSNIQCLGDILAKSGYFSDVRDAAQAAVKVMAGEELGIAPLAAVMGIHIIKGKVTLSANLIAAQVRKHGYNYKHIVFNNEGCLLHFFGKDGELLGESAFTEADAKAAGVFGDMYKKFPRNMYFSRAMSNGAKWYCPEVMSSLPVYVPEELGASVDGDGDVIDIPVERPIDIGGNKPNTQAAADHVANQKIADLKRQMDERRQDPPPATKPAEVVPVDVMAQWARMRDIKSTIEVFGELKKDLIEALDKEAGERVYYGILGKHGVDHANQFKSTKPARNAARDLMDAVKDANTPPVADLSDVPEFEDVPE